MKRTSLKKGKPLKRTGFKRKDKRGTKPALKKKKGLKGHKQPSQAKLKRELDRVFSIYIRTKFPKECYTCRKQEVTLQCGHFVSRQYLATRWDENNCRPQCIGCNIYGHGKPLDFEERLKTDLGADFVEKMKKSRHESLKLSIVWYKEQIQNYKNLLKSMV
jgi:hypothetical protein